MPNRHHRARRYRSRIDIYPDVGERNQGGQHIPQYGDKPRVEGWPCLLMQKAQAEEIYGRQMMEITTHVIECRYTDAVSSDDQLLVKPQGLKLNIVSALWVDEPKTKLIIETKVAA